jgi:amino-acid N-acetyltransferase
MKIRKAIIKDIPKVHRIINNFAGQNLLLPCSFNQLYENIRDFWVCEKKGKVAGCGALHIFWGDLAEIRSLAVVQPEQRKGIGTKLVKTILQEAKNLKIPKIFLLTKVPKFFGRFGFQKISKRTLPRKIWGVCINCPKFPNHCDEIALIYKT